MIERLQFWKERLSLGTPPSSGMREALQWLMLARLCVLFVVLGTLALQQIIGKESYTLVHIELAYFLLTISFAFNLIFASLVDRMPGHWAMAAVHIVFDTVITSAWIYYSGGRDSLVALLYLIQILSVALILYEKGAWFSAIASSLGLGVVSYFGTQPLTPTFLSWALLSGVFLTVGVVGGYLSEELLRTTESLKDKQKKIEKLTALHEHIIHTLPTGLLTVDREMRINFINPAGEHILGQTSPQIVGKPLAEIEPGLMPFFSQVEAAEVQAAYEEAEEVQDVKVSASNTGEFHRTYFVQRNEGGSRTRLQQTVEVGAGRQVRILRGDVASLGAEAGIGNLLGEEASGGRVLLFQDVTKLLHLEDRLKQHEKLAAVGQLAAGIAHEIRNPLASMSASIEMLRSNLPAAISGHENQKLMDIAIREIDRLNRLISEFLDFVKPERFKCESISLPALLADVVTAARNRKEKVAVKFIESYEGEVLAFVNSEKIRQVVWNLIVNAMQAMKKEGEIRVGCARLGPARVKFWVEDEGEGMSDDVLSHLYEPFFTTKDKGTGLGLATAYKIIEAHHGEIEVRSQVRHGTRFEIILQAG